MSENIYLRAPVPGLAVDSRLPAPRSLFGTYETPVKPIPVKGKVQEVPEAFRRHKPQTRLLSTAADAGLDA